MSFTGSVFQYNFAIQKKGMKKTTSIFLSVAAVIMLTVVACSESQNSSSTTAQQDYVQLAKTPGITVLDVRTAEEYVAGHLPNAVNIDINAADFEAKIKAMDPAKKYLVYCRSGSRSTAAVGVMRQFGFTDVVNMEAGISAWNGELVK